MNDNSLQDDVRCRIDAIDAVTPDIRLVSLSAMDGGLFVWRAGQYVSLRTQGHEPRDYSIASVPGSDRLEVHVRRSGGGGLSDALCGDLAVGDEILAQGPFGAAYFRESHGGPLLALAGGTGLAPMKAIVETALAKGLNRDVHLYVGVRTESEIYLERHFIALSRAHANFRFITVVSEPTENSGRRTGLVGDAVAADFQLLYGHQCYIAGPPAMAEACRAMLKLKSVPPHDMFCDLFYADV